MKCLGRSFQVDCEEVSAGDQGSVGQDWEASDPQCKCISPFEGAHSWYCWSIARRILAAGWPTMNGCVRVEYLLTCAYKNIPKSTLLLQRHLTVGGFIRALLETQDTILTVELSLCWGCTIGWAAKWGLAKWPGAERLLVVDDGAAGSLTYGGRAWEVLQRRPLETTLDTGGSHCRLLLSPSIKLMGIRRNG